MSGRARMPRQVLRTSGARQLRQQAAIYRAGKTPLLEAGDRLSALDLRPPDAATTGDQLRAFCQQRGVASMAQGYTRLASTRGTEFAQSALAHSGFAEEITRASVDSAAMQALDSGQAGGKLPTSVRDSLEQNTGWSFEHVRVHDNPAAHHAATMLGARAFTVGNDMYFGNGEWNPASQSGFELIAHEAAHTMQQRGSAPVPGTLQVGGAHDAAEIEADAFARSQRDNGGVVELTPTHCARVQRALSFSHSNHSVATSPIVADEVAEGVTLHATPDPAFDWAADVTVHGDVGDPFDNFEAGFLQVDRGMWFNVFWGNGANRTHRRANMPAPVRDNEGPASDTWYIDAAPTETPAFSAVGDVRSPEMDDAPFVSWPWTNPVAGRSSTTGSFNYGDTFVTYLGVRDTTRPVDRSAFRILACRYWNQFSDGVWDEARAVGSRVRFTTGPSVNRGGVINGDSGEFPAMVGGPIANDTTTLSDT